MKKIIMKNIRDLDLNLRGEVVGYVLFEQMHLLEKQSFYHDFFQKLDKHFSSLGWDIFQMIIDNQKSCDFISSKPFAGAHFELRENIYIKEPIVISGKLENIKKLWDCLYIDSKKLVIWYQ